MARGRVRSLCQKSLPCGCGPSAQQIVEYRLVILRKAAKFRSANRMICLPKGINPFLLKNIVPALNFLQRLPGKIIQPHANLLFPMR